MSPFVSPFPTLPYSFQTTISIPHQPSLQITIPANQTSLQVFESLHLPASWLRDVTRQIDTCIENERRDKLEGLLKQWLSAPSVTATTEANVPPQRREGRSLSIMGKRPQIGTTATVPDQPFALPQAHLQRMNHLVQFRTRGNFQKYFHFIFFSNSQTQAHLVKIEQQMAIVYKDSLRDSRKEIEGMRVKHAEEMTRICLSNDDMGASLTHQNKTSSMDSARSTKNGSRVSGKDDGTTAAQSTTSTSNTTDYSIDVSKIVNQHMNQITQLEQKWHVALQNLKAQQVQQYRKFVKDMYNQIVQDVPDRDGLCQNADLLNLSLHDFRPKLWKKSFATQQRTAQPNASSLQEASPGTESLSASTENLPQQGEYQQRVVNRYVNSLSSYLKKQRTKPIAPPTSTMTQSTSTHNFNDAADSKDSKTSTNSVVAPRCIAKYTHQWFKLCIDPIQYDEASEGSSILSGKMREQSYDEDATVNLFVVYGSDFADTLSLYSSDNEIEQRTHNLGNLYRSRLNAFIVDCCHNPNDNKFIWHSTQFRKVQYHATQTQAPDLHFQDMNHQLQHIHENMVSTEAGDYFVTKHSNLSWIHFMLHLVTLHETNQNAQEYYDRLMNGMEHIFEDCYMLGTHNIFLPVPLTNIPPSPKINQQRDASEGRGSASTVITASEEVLAQLRDLLSCYHRRICKGVRLRENAPRNQLRNFIVFLNPSISASRKVLSQQVADLVEEIFGSRNVLRRGFSSNQ